MADEREFLMLGVALAIGLLFGLERGWHGLQEAEERRVAGVRTFGLIGLLGRASGLLTRALEPPVYGFAFLAVTGVMIAAYALNYRDERDRGITSLVAALVTFALGSLATLGYRVTAAAAAVVSVLLLGFKPQLHHWVSALEGKELHATLKLLLISVVLLPILPNQGYGPGQAFNPYEVWWMVVLIASISFVGYFAIKVAGPDKGTVVTSLFAGLASSTALTVHFSRLARRDRADSNLLSAGILFANGTLFPRILIIVGLIQPGLVQRLALPMALMALLVYAPGVLLWTWRRSDADGDAIRLDNPLELSTAVKFGAFLAVVLLLSTVLKDTFGDAGVLALAATSGVADLNAITLSMARMSQDSISAPLAVTAVVLATATNGVFKTVATGVVGGPKLGLRVGLPLTAASLAGLGAVWATRTWGF